ncbi:MAG TPA: maltose acetyltransferase domain-containing protein [Hyphomicrobiaceae bacterium]|nr:maltose acetyltransferase domain-containing protein [Hyphomicrobiaceae bacterium]
MLAGEHYDPMDPELVAARTHARVPDQAEGAWSPRRSCFSALAHTVASPPAALHPALRPAHANPAKTASMPKNARPADVAPPAANQAARAITTRK